MFSVAMLGFNSYSLEHLMPKKWRNNWGIAIDPENRDFLLQTLGNLAIITASLNSAMPRMLIGTGLTDEILPLEKIAEAIKNNVGTIS